MPRIPSQTAGALETKELATPAFRVGRHKERTIDLSPCQKKVEDILSFRGKTAARLQEAEGRVPSELDQGAAEVAKLLKEGKNLNDFSPQQIAQTYFILRETQGDRETQGSKAYKDWVVKGLPAGKHKERVWERESKLLEQTIGDFERRLVGRRYGKTIESIIRAITGKPSAREILLLEGLINNHRKKGVSEEQAIERATADYSAQEIVKVLGQRGEEISQERIDAARESTNPTDKKFAQAAERIPELAEIGMKKRREIAAWTKADELRKFIGRDIVEADLPDEELILRLMENSPDLLKYKNYQNLKKALSQKKPAELKQLADETTRALVSKHSFNTAVDTAIYIIDRKLPEVEEVEERVTAAKQELTAEAAKRVGEPEIVLMISEELSEEEMINKGIRAKDIKKAKSEYFYQDSTTGEWSIKQAEDDEAQVKQHREQKLRDIIPLLDKEEIEKQIDEFLRKQAERDLQDLQRGKSLTEISEKVYQSYEQEALTKANELIEAYNNQKKPRESIPSVSTLEEVRQSKIQGLLSNTEKAWIDERAVLLIGDNGSREKAELDAVREVLKRRPDIEDRHEASVELIETKELAKLGPEALAILRGRKKIEVADYRKVEAVLGAAAIPDVVDSEGNLKSKEEVAGALAKKRIKTTFWALLILLNIVDLESAMASLQSEGKTTEADEVANLLTGT